METVGRGRCFLHGSNVPMKDGYGCAVCYQTEQAYIYGVPQVVLKAQRRETMLDKLKRLDLEKIDLDEAVYLVSIGDSMKDVYLTGGLEVPQWLTDNVRELNREIANRMAESREKALREVELELVSLRTREEKRADLEAKANRLRATLGRPVGEPAKQ